ncbi:MAG TPA: bifunctional YncE family protein/alkaline phosphatase family protein [Vicinamibacterales bacterium]|jgi:DNA-binding beta-propeller fold protein YncE|nr:bifunctional YncE family protein/alkaline phosphatase family protein [Vicinamibacterales bacterium]
MVHGVVSQRTIRGLTLGCACFFGVAFCLIRVVPRAQGQVSQSVSFPGAQADGTILLPNGWSISPAGKSLNVGTLPLNLVTSPDGKYAIVTNDGISKPLLTVVDLTTSKVKGTTSINSAWLGLAWHPDGTRLYSSGANQNNVQEFTYADGTLTSARTFTLPAQKGDTFAGGLAVSGDGRWLYATRLFAMTLSAIDLTSGQVTETISLPAEPYTCVVSPDGQTVFVSLWGGQQVRAYAVNPLREKMTLDTGEHPSAMALSLDGKRLFVASANSSVVNVFNTFSGLPLEDISTALFPDAPRTTTPDALTVSPDGRTLLVALADMNAVAVVDVSNIGQSFVEGFIPTGWYPTGVAYSRDGKQILVLSGKGNTPAANPLSGGWDSRLRGLLSIVPTPDRLALADLTRRTYGLTPYTDAIRLTPSNVPIGSPVPRVVGGSSPIKHVFYIIRENRTYDQILGDIPEGNGAPNLTLFGRDVTPNAHAVAQNFALFDNFYTDADVSYDGHSFSTAAYATDVVQKLWQTLYAGRGGLYLGEGGGFMRNPFGNLAAPESGYLWDYATRAGVSVRSYGEFVYHVSKSPAGDVVADANVPGLKGLVAPAYAGFDLDIADNKRVDSWLAEFRDFVSNGNLPTLSILHLGNDHTKGTAPGALSPRAMIADNDLALGRIVETISSSVYWRDSAIFVVEDDAQSGPDHVDSHRSVLLVASPFAKRNFVDHSFYTTSGVLRTMELILGIEPMSQYDAAATPLYNAFNGTPSLSSYQHLTPRVIMSETNLASAYGAKESLAMDFTHEDRAPDVRLNEILWRSVKGANSPMPPPRRSIFVRPSAGGDADPDN